MHIQGSIGHRNNPVQERRKYERVRTKIPCELIVRGNKSALRIETSDLSSGGCYIETMFTIPVGTPVELKLWIDGVRVDTHAVVATCDPQVGNGLRFVIITSKDRARIQAFVYNLLRSQL
jgi:c-di-GMP-binding flagellar brake protein YcgR